jgi:hypothetical protein
VRQRMARLNWMAILAVLVLLGGCAGLPAAAPPPIPAPEGGHPDDTDSGWWQARFRMAWLEDQPPEWYLDLLIAHRVVAPVLQRHRSQIRLWRFHRRAAPDGAGHQFSFIFYASTDTAARVFADLEGAPLVAALRSNDRLLAVVVDDTDQIDIPEVEGTADPAWSPAMRRSWPHFIMGASQTWLDLVAAVAEEEGVDPADAASLEELENSYRQVSRRIDAIWREEGRHAFLHHLNALFAYQPVVVYEKRYMKF